MRVRSVHTDAALLHRLVGAADIILHCHRFAPGGFSPLYGMRYGAVPVAPRSGAFADAVVDWDATSRTGTGFLFSPHRPEDIPAAMRRATRAAQATEIWDDLVARVSQVDLSWRTVGMRHAELGREAIRAAAAAAAPTT
jgi:starch synthase